MIAICKCHWWPSHRPPGEPGRFISCSFVPNWRPAPLQLAKVEGSPLPTNHLGSCSCLYTLSCLGTTSVRFLQNIFIKYLLHIAKQGVNVDIHSREVMLSDWIPISWPRMVYRFFSLQSLPCTLYSTFSVNSTEHLVIATDLRESSSTKLHRLRLSV